MGRLEDKFAVIEEEAEKVEDVKKVEKVIRKPIDVRPASVVKELQHKPMPKGEYEEIICGIPVEWHDLESFIISLSPQHFANTLKLQEQKVRRKELSYLEPRKPIGGKFIAIMIIAVIMVIVGVMVLMFGPQLMGMFGGGV